jgi:hypothetical protein
MGLHSVKVWADTTEEAARATAAVERTLENMMTVFDSRFAEAGILKVVARLDVYCLE